MAAYHGCSEVLQPHLLHFLQDVSQTPGLPFQGKGPTASGDPPTRADSRRVLGHCSLNICGGPTGTDVMGCLISGGGWHVPRGGVALGRDFLVG